jgi:hypothetical protein
MANKPRMGSDPFQKNNPLGWIDRDKSDMAEEGRGLSNQLSNPGKPSKLGTPSASSKASNSSKHELPSPPSTSDHLSTPSRPRRGTTTSKGLRPGWTRATFIVREETLQQLKAVAYWDRKELKRVVEEAFRNYLGEKTVKPIPPEDRSSN